MKKPSLKLLRHALPGFFLILLGSGSAWSQPTITYSDGQNDATAYDTSPPNNPTTLTIGSGAATQSGILSGTGAVIKTGAGSLTLSGVNTYTGGTTLSAGTLVITNANSLGTGTLTFAGGTTLGRTVNFLTLANELAINGDVTFSGTDENGSLTLNGAVSLGTGTHTITTDNLGNPRFFGSISGDGGLTIAGNSGEVTFDGTSANTYTGLTTVLSGATLSLAKNSNQAAIPGNLTIDNGGTVSVINNDNQFGAASTVTVNGALGLDVGIDADATFALTIPELLGSGAISYENTFNPGTLTVGSGDFSGTISETGNGLSLVKTGPGTLTLSGNNTYTGGTTITAGTLQIGDGGTTGSILGNVTNNANLTFNRSNDLSFGGVISGTGSLTKQGGGSLTLSGANTYSGGTTISAGTLQIGNGGTTGSILGNVTNNANLTFNRSDDLSFGGVISGTGSLTKQGGGSLTLSGNNTYSGGTALNAGTLVIGSNSALGSGTLTIEAGTTLGSSGARTIANPLSVNGDFSISTNGGAFEIDGTVNLGASDREITTEGTAVTRMRGAITGTGGLVKSGSQALSLLGSAANTYTGDTTVKSGQLNLLKTAGVTAIAGDLIIESGATVAQNRSNQIADSSHVTLNGTYRLLQGASETIRRLTGSGALVGDSALSALILTIGEGDFSGSLDFDGNDSRLIKTGPGTLTLSGTNLYTGGTAINGGTLSVSANQNLGAPSTFLIFDGGTLQNTAAFSSARATTLNAGGGTFETLADLTHSGTISGTGSLTKDGASTLTLSGNNTYTGGTTVAGGTLSLGSNSAAGTGTITTTGSVIDYADGVTIANPILLNSNDTQLQVLTGSATQSGIISETGGARPLEKIGGGTLTLSGNNTYSGGTNLNEGTLVVTNANSLGTGTLTFADGTTLGRTVNSLTLANALAINGDVTFSGTGGNNDLDLNGAVSLGTGTHTITTENTGNPRFFGIISGDAGLTIAGSSGEVTFIGTGANTYTGLTTVLSGATLTLAKSANQAAIPGNLTIDSGGTVNVFVHNPFGATSRVAVNGELNILGASISFFTIPELLGSGAISFDAPPGSGTLTVGSGDFSGTISEIFGPLSLVKSGAGTLILSGNNTYSDGTTVQAGTLSLGSNTAAGTGTITTTGSVIDYTNGVSISNPININSDTTQLQVLTGSATQSGVIGQTGGARPLEKIGAGTLVLSAANTYTGATTITSGTLDVTGSLASTTVNVGTGAQLRVDGASLADTAAVVLNGSGNLTLTGAETIGSLAGGGTSTVTLGVNTLSTGGNNSSTSFAGVLSGTGGLTKEGSGTFTLTGANTYTGATTVRDGSLVLGSGGAINGGSGSSNIGFTSGANGILTVQAGGSFSQSGGVRLGVFSGASGTLNVAGNFLTGSNLSVGFVAGGTGAVHLSSGTLTAGGTIIGAGGTGSLGTLDITGGTLTTTNRMLVGDINSNGTVTQSGGTVEITSMNALEVGGSGATGTYTLSGTGVIDAPSLAIGFSTLSNGIFNLNGGTVNAPTTLLTFSVGSSGTLNLGTGTTVGILNTASINGGAGTATVNFNHNQTDYFFTNDSTVGGTAITLSGSASVNLLGSGTTTFTGASTYTGATNINAGTLIVNNLTDSATGTGAVTVASGATLGGSGRIAGAVTVQNGGLLAPGTSAGTLTVGSLTLNPTSQLDFELDTPNVIGGGFNDLIVVNGDLILDGILNITDLGNFGDGTYRLFDYTGNLTDNGLLFGTVPTPFDLTVDTSTANEINLLVAAATAQFWDGANTTPNGTIDGGTGTWNGSTTNWTNTGGNANTSWAGGLAAIFAGTAGTVTLADGFTADASAYDFQVGGYTVERAGTGQIAIAGNTPFTTNSGNTIINAPISGGGLLEKQGAGTLTLTGVNTYTGGTTVSAGTLQIGNGGTTGSITGNVTNNANLTFNRSDDLTFGGVISGTGSLTKLGAGTLTLSAVNTYTGGTTISAGELQIGNGGTNGSITGNVLNNGFLIFNRSDDIAFGGTITGTGGLGKLGAGRLEFSGSNSGATGTFIDAGTLAVTGTINHPGGSLVVANGAGTTATLEINGSGSVSAGTGLVGFGDGSTGLATVTAGTWTNTSSLVVGGFGAGTVEISGTGNVASDGGVLGNVGGSSGTVRVSGGSWINSGALGVGVSGAGLLEVSGTGLVSNTIGVIGTDTTSTGTATVSGGTWTNSTGLIIGDEGEGTVNLTGGTLNAPNIEIASDAGSTGILNIGTGTSAGILNATAIAGGSGTATVNFNHTGMVNFAPNLTGSARVNKLGTGTTVLAGTNTYTGPTTISGGTLASGNLPNTAVTVQAGGALSPGGAGVAQSITVGGLSLDGGNLLFDIGTGGTDFISVADGLGALNAPTQFLFTDNGLANGTYALLDGLAPGWDLGLLSFAGIAPFGGNFLLSGDGTQLFFSAFDGGVISGPALQNTTPVGTPTMADFLVQGFVTTGTPTQNNVINSLTFNPNSLLQVFNNLTVTSGNFNVPSGEGTIMGGNVITPGDFNKNGAGILNVNSSFGVGGSANVNAGALMVNGTFTVANGLRVMQNALLGGVGIIRGNVLNNGTVAPGNSPGTLTINGDFTQSSSGTLQIEADSLTSFDRLFVSGHASLAGTLQFLPSGGFQPSYGQQFAFLQAGGISGGFDSIVAPSTFRGRFINQGNVGILLLAPDTYTRVATNQNQFHVARALDSFIPAVGNDKEVVSTALDFLTAEQYPAAFDQIMPSFHESVANIGINLAQSQGQLMQQQLSSVRLGGRGFRTAGVPMEPLKHDKDGTKVSDPKDFKSPILRESANLRWSAWAQGNGIFSRTTSPTAVPTYRSQSGGFLAGADYTWSDSFVTGLFAGYQGLYAKYANGADTKMNGVRFGGYATYDPVDSGFYADAVVWGGASNYKTRRKIQFSTIDRTASANQDTGELSTLLGGGYDWQVGNFTFGPAVSLQYTYFGVAPFTESGADSLDLRVGQQNANSLQSYIGARAAYTAKLTDSILLIPEVRMFWQHEFLNNPRTIDASLDGGAGPTFGYRTQTPSRDAVWAGAGATLQLGERVNTYLFYNADFGRQDYISHVVSAGLNFRF